MAKRCPSLGRRRAVVPMAGGVEAGDAVDDGGERRALVLLDKTPIVDVLEPSVGDDGGDLLHGVEAEVAAVGDDRGEQGADIPGVDPLLAGLLEADAEPEVVLDLDEQVGKADRAAAGVQPAVELGEAGRAARPRPSSAATRRRRTRPAGCQRHPPGTGRTHPTDVPSVARSPRRDRRGTRFAPRTLRGTPRGPAGRTGPTSAGRHVEGDTFDRALAVVVEAQGRGCPERADARRREGPGGANGMIISS